MLVDLTEKEVRSIGYNRYFTKHKKQILPVTITSILIFIICLAIVGVKYPEPGQKIPELIHWIARLDVFFFTLYFIYMYCYKPYKAGKALLLGISSKSSEKTAN